MSLKLVPIERPYSLRLQLCAYLRFSTNKSLNIGNNMCFIAVFAARCYASAAYAVIRCHLSVRYVREF